MSLDIFALPILFCLIFFSNCCIVGGITSCKFINCYLGNKIVYSNVYNFFKISFFKTNLLSRSLLFKCSWLSDFNLKSFLYMYNSKLKYKNLNYNIPLCKFINTFDIGVHLRYHLLNLFSSKLICSRYWFRLAIRKCYYKSDTTFHVELAKLLNINSIEMSRNCYRIY